MTRRFRHAMRVYVHTDADGRKVYAAGMVWRLRRADNGAWIRLDKRQDDNAAIHPFPADDERGRHVLAYPEDCYPEHLAPALCLVPARSTGQEEGR